MTGQPFCADNPQTQRIKRWADYYFAETLRYFVSWPNSGDLLNALVDHKTRDGITLTGSKFQLATVIEGLTAIERRVGCGKSSGSAHGTDSENESSNGIFHDCCTPQPKLYCV